MCKLFEDWSPQIQRYCNEHNLSYEKAKRMSKCWGKNDIVLQYYDPEAESVKKGLGLLDETPMPAVLWITKNGDKLEFEQTEYTQKYLSV
jgi:hypothetical protein